jgi:hypothetical protein
VAELITKTLARKLKAATHWSVRAIAKETGIAKSNWFSVPGRSSTRSGAAGVCRDDREHPAQPNQALGEPAVVALRSTIGVAR